MASRSVFDAVRESSAQTRRTNHSGEMAAQLAKGALTPRYAVISLYLLFLGFALATARHSGVGDNMGSMGELVRMLTLGPAYLIAGLVIFSRTKLVWAIVLKSKLYIAFIAFSGLSALWSIVPGKVLIYSIHNVGYFMVCVLLLIMLKDRGPNFLFRHLTLASLGLVGVSILISVYFPGIGVHESTRRWQGVTGNPNTLGMFCVICVWSLLMLHHLSSELKYKVFSLLLLIIPLLALKGGRDVTSVTSLVLSILLCMTFPLFVTMSQGSLNSRVFKIIFTCFLAFCGLISLYAFLPEIFDLDYILAKLGRDRTMTGRTRIWEMGLKIFFMKPDFGWGFDGLLSVMKSLHFDITQFHNGYLDLAIRGGVVGLLFLFLIVLVTYRGIAKIIRKNSILGWGLAAFATAYLLHNLTEASIMRPTHLYWFTFMLVYMISCNEKLLFPSGNPRVKNDRS